MKIWILHIFLIIIIIIRCSGMFRDVPCSWFYRRPHFASLRALISRPGYSLVNRYTRTEPHPVCMTATYKIFKFWNVYSPVFLIIICAFMLYSMVRIFSDLLNARNQWCSIDLFCHSVHQYLPNEKFNQSLSKSLSSSMTESICFRPIRSSTGVDRSFSSTRVFNNFLSWTTDHENYSRFNAGHEI